VLVPDHLGVAGGRAVVPVVSGSAAALPTAEAAARRGGPGAAACRQRTQGGCGPGAGGGRGDAGTGRRGEGGQSDGAAAGRGRRCRRPRPRPRGRGGTGAMPASLRPYLAEGERAAARYALGVPRQAPLGQAGATVGQRAGTSLEFKDHRAYEPGDDLRHIDWSAYARTDQLSVKLFREEVTPHLDIVVDASRSMNLEDTHKGAAAVALA